ncbi:MAG: hypothetical protein LBQ69_07315, partial [Treponema sp.]|nr:hypothetical protein [Treponema sp.]
MAFFLRFKTQLQRTRPELIPRLEDMAVHAARKAGGTVSSNRGVLQAAFNEKPLAFWLDMLLLIEKLRQAVNESEADLYGYSLLLGENLVENPKPLCCFLSGEKFGGGVFLDQAAVQALRQYLTLEEQGEWTRNGAKHGAGTFFRVKDSKIYVQTTLAGFPLRETSAVTFEEGQRQAILVYGQSIEGKRDELYRRFAGYSIGEGSENFPPLFVRFGRGGLKALADSWAEWMRPSAEARAKEIIDYWEILFRQRLKAGPSPFAVRICRRFFKSLLNLYVEHAKLAKARPIVLLENIDAADGTAADIAIEALKDRLDILLLGTCGTDIDSVDLQNWRPLFPRVLKSNSSVSSRPQFPDISQDLWEISYICSLLCRYFPPDLVPGLLQETGKNRETVSRALSLLHTLRVIDTPADPQPWHGDFLHAAEAELGEKAEGLKALTCGLLLAWVRRKKTSPCIRLLEALAELGRAGDIDDSLILQSLYGEASFGDRAALEQALDGGTLEAFAGQKRAPALRYIIPAMVAVHFGSADDIRAALALTPPDCSAYPLLKAQALFCRSLYFLGQRDNKTTLEMAKEITLLCQGHNSPCLSHYYRIFALASLSQKRIGEAIDYFGFALENAEQYGNAFETGMSAYYAASMQLLHGNLSRAKTLAEKARRHFLKAGSPEWADRSRFIEGRIVFEAGYYQQAIGIFENIINNPDGESSPEKTGLLEAWTFRARVNSHPPPYPQPQGSGADAGFFEIEALYLGEDYSRAAELASTLANIPAEADFLFTERPDWRSGFSQCELLYFSQAS